ncbi:unnamed protein product [Ectocarpus sp. CCAP 1310/34]|nr:unnamed protein product [Ectocarpus sp. CCAP 1310/34]
MIRVRSLAAACARECVRFSSAGSSTSNGVGARAATGVVALRALRESSSLASAQPPSAADEAHSEGAGVIQNGNQQHGGEFQRVEAVGDLLRQHARAREDWTGPLGLTDYERNRLPKELVRRIKRLAGANKRTKMRLVIQILDEGRQQGIKELVVYKAVLKQLLTTYRESKDAAQNLERVIERMEEDGLQPDVTTYNHILDLHALLHNSEAAVAVYEEMLSRGVEPNQRTASHMIVAHSRGCHDAMYRAVEEMYAKGWQGSRVACLGMIAVMGIRRDYDGVLYTIRRMREESKLPTEAAFVWAYRAAENLGQVETAKQLFQHRAEAGLPPAEYVYVKMMSILMKAGKAEECLEYWRQLVCVHGFNGVVIHPETYNLAIKCTMVVGNQDEMEAVLAMMEAQRVVPTDDTYSAALGGLEKWFTPHRARGAQRAFEAIARSGPPPSTRVLQRKAKGCAHAGLWQEAEELFSLVLAENGKLSNSDWKCLMMSQFYLERFGEVKKSWSRSVKGLEVNKAGHSHRKLEYSLKAAKALGDVDWALEVRDAASEAGKRSVHLDRVWVEILLEAGRPQEARDVLKEWEALALRASSARVFQGVYELALESCEKSGDVELGLEFFDGMRSASPPYRLRSSCPSVAFILKALKDAGRAEEMVSFFDEFLASLVRSTCRPTKPGVLRDRSRDKSSGRNGSSRDRSGRTSPRGTSGGTYRRGTRGRPQGWT